MKSKEEFILTITENDMEKDPHHMNLEKLVGVDGNY